MHELVRQYCEEHVKQDPEESGGVRDRHSDYYTVFLQEQQTSLQQREILEEVMEEVGNVRAAWDWALTRKDADAIYECVQAVLCMYSAHGWYHEAVYILDRAAARLRELLRAAKGHPGHPPLEEGWIALSRVLQVDSEFSRRMGLAERTRALTEESVASAGRAPPSVRQRVQRAWFMVSLGMALQWVGEYSRADELFRQAYGQLKELGNRLLVANMAYFVGENASYLGEWAEAERFFEEVVAAFGDTGHQVWAKWYLFRPSAVLCARGEYERAGQLAQEHWQDSQDNGSLRAGAHVALARVDAALGRYELAGQRYQEALAIAEKIGNRDMEVPSLNGLAAVALALGRYAKTKQLFDRSLVAARETSNRWQTLVALVGLGDTYCALGEMRQARQLLCQALEDAVETGAMPKAMDALVGLAYLSAKEEGPEGAVELLTLALRHSATTQMTKDRADPLLSRLESELSPEVFATATARGQARDLEEVVAEVLRVC